MIKLDTILFFAGVLEKPKIQVDFEEVSYKLFFIGKAGCEKNNFISELTGISVPSQDSNGIHKTNIYWPTKIWDKVILFRLQCWEAGDSGVKKFSHILPVSSNFNYSIIFLCFTVILNLHTIFCRLVWIKLMR